MQDRMNVSKIQTRPVDGRLVQGGFRLFPPLAANLV
jgi:hypothetical protein